MEVDDIISYYNAMTAERASLQMTTSIEKFCWLSVDFLSK
jgi:hypothetical protein